VSYCLRLPRKSNGAQGTPGGANLAGTSDALALEIVRDQGTPMEGQRKPGRTSDPLAVEAAPRLHTPATQKQTRRRPRNARGTPEGRQGVHPTPWQWRLSRSCNAKAAETKECQRDARGTPGCTSDPWQWRLPHACHAKAAETKERQRNARGTPGRTSDLLAVEATPSLPRKSGGDQGTPKGRQGVHPTPWQWRLSHACHAKGV